MPSRTLWASYADEDGNEALRLEFGELFLISDEDGTRRQAYAFDEFLNTSLGYFHRRYFLDGEFRVVRDGFPCGWKPGDSACDISEVNWLSRYQLAPYGLGYPSAFADGIAEQQTGFAWHNVTGTTRTSNGVIEVEFDVAHLSGMAAAGLLEAPLVYADGRALPDRIVKSSGRSWGLADYQEGEPLAPIEPWPPRRLPSAREVGAWTYFPGDGEDPFGSGITHREAIDALRAHSSEVDSWLRGKGCLLIFGSHEPASAETDPLSLVSYTRAEFEVVVQPENGPPMDWRFIHEQSPLESAFRFESPEPINIDKPCPSFDAALPGNITAGEFLAKVEDLVLGTPVEGFAFVCDSTPSSPASDLAPCQFYADLEEEQSFGFNHYITMSTRTGWWNSMIAEPETVERFDGRLPPR